MSVKTEVIDHGIFWVMGKDKMPKCPECERTSHYIEMKVNEASGDIVAECTCHYCGCKFKVSKKDDE